MSVIIKSKASSSINPRDEELRDVRAELAIQFWIVVSGRIAKIELRYRTTNGSQRYTGYMGLSLRDGSCCKSINDHFGCFESCSTDRLASVSLVQVPDTRCNCLMHIAIDANGGRLTSNYPTHESVKNVPFKRN